MDDQQLLLKVVYPATWRAESIAWARRRGLSQAEVDEIEEALIEFRRRRDRIDQEYPCARLTK